MTSSFLITRPLASQSYIYINTEIFGDVEIRSANYDLDIERELLKKAETSTFAGKSNASNYDLSNRMSTIVEAENEVEAIQLANDKFVTVLDLKANDLCIADINLSKVGLVRNLSTGSLKCFFIRGSFRSTAFIRNLSDIQRWGVINLMLEKERNPDNNDELSQRFIKSLHWSHNSRDEENKQLKIIFNYFCLEALFKENEKDNINGMIRCFLGFPSRKYYHDVDKDIIEDLQDNENYSSLIKKIPMYLDEIRKFRNDSVHAGFRSVDISNEKLNLYDNLLNLATSRCLHAVKAAIINNGIKSISEFKNKAGFIFNETVQVNDILNTVVFSLLNNGYNIDIFIVN